MDTEIRRYPDVVEMSREAAVFISALSRETVSEKGMFTLVLSGGKTPRLLYETLARPPWRDEIPWAKVHLFWGDERAVPPGHPQSNFAMACRNMISAITIPSANVHPIPIKIPVARKAARAYEGSIREFFGIKDKEAPPPSFDLILLGMGADGHTASLFPGDDALEEEERWMAAVEAPEGSVGTGRVTMTLPLINGAATVIFLVAGPEKADLFRKITDRRNEDVLGYPAARVRPDGRLIWFVSDCAPF